MSETKIMKQFFTLIVGCVLCCSCSSLHGPGEIADSIPIYENQPEIINGVYFNEPYSYTYNYKTFLDFLEIEDHNVDSVQVSLINPERMKVVSYKALDTKTNFVEGKLVKGTFQIKKEKGWFGIPYLLFTNSKETLRISVGTLDEIILQHYHYKITQLFGTTTEEETTDYYRYSKTLDVIP